MKTFVAFVLLAVAIPFTTARICDSGWISFRNSCYYVSTYEHYTYSDAERLCRSTGAELVTINDDLENLFLEEFVRGQYKLWIGLNDIKEDGNFVWEDHEENTYENWQANQPVTFDGIESCVHLATTNVGQWNHLPCYVRLGFICENAEGVCVEEPVGIEDGDIPNSQMTASSNWDQNHMAYNGRLNWCEEGFSCCWAAENNVVGEWLQIDLGYPRKVTKVATQGRQDCCDQWVTSYSLLYGDGSTWTYVDDIAGNRKVFAGNIDRTGIVTHQLGVEAFTARYVRFVVQSWHGHISLRVEVYACA